MENYKFYRKDNYIILSNNTTKETFYGFVKEVQVDKSNLNKPHYRFFNIKDFNSSTPLVITQLLKEDGSTYTQAEFEEFYTKNTGNFNGGGSAPGVQSVTGSGVDNTDPQNPVITAGGATPNLQQVIDISGNVEGDYKGISLSSTNIVGTDLYKNSLDLYPEYFSQGFRVTGSNGETVVFFDSSIEQDSEIIGDTELASGLVLGYSKNGNNDNRSEIYGNKNLGIRTKYFLPPNTVDQAKLTLTSTKDFKTINGESIIGSGNLTTGSGATPTIQQVLDTGNISNKAVVISNTSSGSLPEVFKTNYESYGIEIEESGKNIRTNYYNGDINVQDPVNGGETYIKFPTSLNTRTTFTLPADKPAGDYLLATTADIPVITPPTLENTLANGNTANNFMSLTNPDGNIIFSGTGLTVVKDNELASIGKNYLQLTNTISNKQIIVRPENIDYRTGTGNGSGRILPHTTSENIDFKLPNKPTGNYTFAFTEDIPSPPTLQSVLQNGNTSDAFEFNISPFPGAIGNYSYIGVTFEDQDNSPYISQYVNGYIKYNDRSNSGQTLIKPSPVFSTNTEFIIPATKPNGVYTLATLDDVVPSINIVENGDINIPNGSKTRMITLTNSSPQIVTLPAISDSVGSIYFITNESAGNVVINSKLGGNDIWNSNITSNTFILLPGSTVRVINDGRNFKI